MLSWGLSFLNRSGQLAVILGSCEQKKKGNLWTALQNVPVLPGQGEHDLRGKGGGGGGRC